MVKEIVAWQRLQRGRGKKVAILDKDKIKEQIDAELNETKIKYETDYNVYVRRKARGVELTAE